jgi:hypothetical protein
MVDEKIVDFGTFILGALLGALLYYTPQIQQLAGDDPMTQLAVGIIMMTISQIGSRYAIGQVKQETPVIQEPMEQ